MHKKAGEDRKCSSEDTTADRQTQTDTLITILRSSNGAGVKKQEKYRRVFIKSFLLCDAAKKALAKTE